MMIFQILLFVFMGLAVAMYYATAKYKQKKQSEYGDDERWKAIVASAMRIVYRYHTVLLALVVLGSFAYRIIDFDIQFGFGDVFGILSFVLLGASIAEFIALNIYDRKM
jgi:hypothetical protein